MIPGVGRGAARSLEGGEGENRWIVGIDCIATRTFVLVDTNVVHPVVSSSTSVLAIVVVVSISKLAPNFRRALILPPLLPRYTMPLQPLLQSSLDSLIDSIINLQSSASTYAPKRYYSSLFQLLPDKREYADYYILIKEPRSLVGIQVSGGAAL